MPDATVTVTIQRADLDSLDALHRITALVQELEAIPGVAVSVHGSLGVDVRARAPFDTEPVDVVNLPPNASPEEAARVAEVHRQRMAGLARLGEEPPNDP